MDQAKRLKELKQENTRLKRLLGTPSWKGDPQGSCVGKLLSPAMRCQAVNQARNVLGHDRLSERRDGEVLDQPRSTQRRVRHVFNDEPRLVRRMVELASGYGRYGYHLVTALLQDEGWQVNHERIERLWRQEGLKVPQKQPKRHRLWLNDSSCERLRSAYRDHVLSYDFVADQRSDRRTFRMLTLIDEHTRECLAIDTARMYWSY